MLTVYKHKFFLKYERTPEGFQGPRIRGSLGLYLKKYLHKDIYDYIFNTPTDTKIMRRYNEAPKAFVIDIPFVPSSTMPLNIILFGKSNGYIEAFRKALGEFGRHDDIGIYYEGCDALEADFKERPGGINVLFETPTNITYKGKMWEKPEFHILIRNALRRVFLVSYYHYAVRLDIDFDRLIKEAENISLSTYQWEMKKIERRSSRKGGVMCIEGYVGKASYNDVGSELYGCLSLADLIHVGKYTVFGCGKIIVKKEA